MMRIFVLSLSSRRLKTSLAEFSSEAIAAVASAPENWPAPSVLRQITIGAEDKPANEKEALERLYSETAEWPAPDALAALVTWKSTQDRVPSGRVLHVAANHVSAARATLPDLAASGGMGLDLTLQWAERLGVSAFVVPYVAGAELPAEAQETGLSALRHRPRFHALGSEMLAVRAAELVGERFADARVVVAHLGNTASVTAYENGRVVSSSGSGTSGGPLALRQAGPLSPEAWLRLAETENLQSAAQVFEHWRVRGGLHAMTGLSSPDDLIREEPENEKVRRAAAALVHQIASAVGASVGSLSGRPDAIVLGGALAVWDSVMDRIEDRLGWMAPVFVLPGDHESDAVARAAARSLAGWAPTHVYQSETDA